MVSYKIILYCISTGGISMKKLAVIFMMIFFTAFVNEAVYANPGKAKGHDKSKDKNEKSIGAEKSWLKNQKAVDARKNWGQLKKELKDEDNPDALSEFFGVGFDETRDYTDKELKESIKAERRVRRELRRNEDCLGDGVDIEVVIDEYLYRNTERVENYLSGLEDFDFRSLEKITRAKEKFDAAVGVVVEE